MHFTTEGTEKVRIEHYAVHTKKILLTAYHLLFFVTTGTLR